MHIKNNRGAPKGGFASWKEASAIIIIGGKYRSLEQFSCATPVPVAYKKGGKRRIRGEWVIHLTC